MATRNTLASVTVLLTTHSIMRIFVNDEPREAAPASTLAHFMDSLALRTFDGIAVAVNDTVVPRTVWADHVLADADRLLVIQATQGG